MRRRYIVTILTALAVVAYLAQDDKQSTQDHYAAKAIQLEPDYIVKGLEAQNYNKNGLLERQIEAVSARHYPTNDTTELIKPSLILRQGKMPQWQIKAKQGNLSQAQMLELDGNVNVLPLQKSDGQFSLKTEHLSIDLKQQMADTDAQVLITSSSSQLTSKGLKLDLIKQQAKFKSEVQGIHDPNAQ